MRDSAKPPTRLIFVRFFLIFYTVQTVFRLAAEAILKPILFFLSLVLFKI